jgi:putative membrane protein
VSIGYPVGCDRKQAMRVGFLIGIILVILLVGWQGVASIVDRLSGAGWGIMLVALFIPPDLILRATSFHLLFAPGRAPRFSDTVFAMWIGSSVNFLLPVATVGGEFVKARILTLRSVLAVDAVASVVLDKTVQAMSVLLWALIGIAIFAVVAPPDEPLVIAAFVGVVLMAFGIAGFVLVQYAGAFGKFARPAAKMLSNEKWQSLIERAADLDVAIRDIYHRPVAIIASTCLRLAKRAVMAGEVWLVAWFVGYPIGLAEAVMLNSLAVALRSAAFAIPGGLGVQEGGYVMFGALVGLPPDVMLAISLATRLGEFIEGLPGLLAWQFAEGRAYMGRRS